MKLHLKTLAFLVAAAIPAPAATRLKDVASLEGMRDNQLIGYGLVVGLAGTGDRRQAAFSTQSLDEPAATNGRYSRSDNAHRKEHCRCFSNSDVAAFCPTRNASGCHRCCCRRCCQLARRTSGDDQPSRPQWAGLRSGTRPSGHRWFCSGRAGNSQSVNHPTVGRVPNGAIIERAAPSVAPGAQIRLQVKEADFTTAARIASVINQHFEGNGSLAKAENSALVSVAVPAKFQDRSIEFVSELENLTVEMDRPARVVVNERTGTIVMGKDVRIAPVAILQGNLTVEIRTTYDVSQPAPLSKNGTTEVIPQTAVDAKEEKARNVVLKKGATIEELVQALTAIGSSSRDVIAILQSLRAAGALEAELEVL